MLGAINNRTQWKAISKRITTGKEMPLDIYGENNELWYYRGERSLFRQLDNAKKMIRRARDAHTEQAKVVPVTIKKVCAPYPKGRNWQSRRRNQ